MIDEWHNDDRWSSSNYDRLALPCRHIFRPLVQISGQQSAALGASEGVLIHTFKTRFLPINQKLQIVAETMPTLQWLPYVHPAKFTTSILTLRSFGGCFALLLCLWGYHTFLLSVTAPSPEIYHSTSYCTLILYIQSLRMPTLISEQQHFPYHGPCNLWSSMGVHWEQLETIATRKGHQKKGHGWIWHTVCPTVWLQLAKWGWAKE